MELFQSMQVFARVAELGSFTKAADSIQLGRPQVTRAIQELEASLGVRLFQRTTRRVRLTTEGEQFYERVKDILGNVAAATSMFDLTGASMRGKLRVDIPSAFSRPAFIASLQEFTRRHPDIEMTLGVTDRTVDLVAEGVDCVLRIGELPNSSLIARRIGLATMVTCAAPSYLQAFGSPQTPDDLSAHRGVSFLSGQNHRPLPWHFLQEGTERSYVNRRGIIVNESNAYVQSGVAGFGILQAPGITLDSCLADGSLVEVLKSFRPRPRPVSLLYPSRSHLAPQVQAFIDWVSRKFPSLYADWLEQ
ncbi:LysR family transcriptional regulator [Pseudomonas gingeri]|uniref:LysR substrate-binding domain-containing protein n=1 Tax=Pseudomonas gingeri TaxID=117681 RepID=UPI0015A33EFF|nr:LysR family transcriptional regulator [Pseudomonas gingeri]NVZ60694.1 LysR family transcriptional regulator [Pseudomonas gingeri]NVZ76176.1 LysR family transcriptional regulator [Pseudomonas gingeri]